MTAQTFTIRGSQTGVYQGTYTLLDNSAQFSATQVFKAGEEIRVNLSQEIKTEDGVSLTPYTWQFRTPVTGGAAETFVNSGQNLENADTYAAALGDLDGDGDLDIFVGNYNGPSTVWLNDGTGHLSDSGQGLESYGVYAVALGDLDSDGDLDAAAGTDNGSQVWLNEGTGIFGSGQAFAYSSIRAIALGDLDGDGDLDVFAGGEVWLNEGLGTFSLGQDLSFSPYALALGDLDALVGTDWSGNRVWLNDGRGNFSENQSLDYASTYALALGDLDGDCDLDALARDYNGANVLWLNDGAGYFSDSSQSLGSSNSRVITLGDLDGDGDLDAFIGNDSGQANQVWLKQITPDLTLSKTGPTIVLMGEPVTYTFSSHIL